MKRKTGKRGAGPAWTALALGAAAILLAWSAATGSKVGWWSMEQGLQALPFAFGLAVFAAALGLFARYRRRDGQLIAVAALLLGTALAAYLGGEKWNWDRHPALHDVTTDLHDPPAFSAIGIRRDLREGVPVLNRPGHELLTRQEQWMAVHADAYPELRPVQVPLSPALTTAKAAEIANDLGWEVVRVDAGAGMVEAVATSRFFGFKDDVAVRVRPVQESSSLVDVRSVSRRGIGDGGRGAHNINRLLRGLRD